MLKIIKTMFVVGPAIGYIAGGQFLSMYVDIDLITANNIKDLKLTPTSPLWVGAWWIGFILAWLMSWACALVISLYPASLPGSDVHNEVSEN